MRGVSVSRQSPSPLGEALLLIAVVVAIILVFGAAGGQDRAGERQEAAHVAEACKTSAYC